MVAGSKGAPSMSPVVVSLIAFIVLVAGAGGVHAVEILATSRRNARR